MVSHIIGIRKVIAAVDDFGTVYKCNIFQISTVVSRLMHKCKNIYNSHYDGTVKLEGAGVG